MSVLTPELLLAVVGLAVIDAFNPATIGAVALILLSPTGPRERTATMFVVGAYLTVFGMGAVVFLSAGAAAGAVESGLVWVRGIALSLAALGLIFAGLRRTRSGLRPALRLPAWITPRTAPALGILVTGVDLPNAIPYLIAIERLVTAEVPAGQGLAVLAGYALIYCLPCLVLLAAGLSHGDAVRARLSTVYERFGTAKDRPRNLWATTGYLLLAGLVLAWAWG